MASAYNKAIVLGNLVRNPEIRYIANGTPVTKFTLAVNGRKPEDTQFLDITAWGKLAEAANTHLQKGSKVLVDARMEVRSYDDPKFKNEAGQICKRKAFELVAQSIQFLGNAKGNAPAAVSADEAGAAELEESLLG